MKRLQIAVKCLLRDDSGQDLVEYALVVALISLGSITAMGSLASSISTMFGTVGTAITSGV